MVIVHAQYNGKWFPWTTSTVLKDGDDKGKKEDKQDAHRVISLATSLIRCIELAGKNQKNIPTCDELIFTQHFVK